MTNSQKEFRILDKFVGTKLRNDIGNFYAGAYRTLYGDLISNHLLLYTGLEQPTPVRIQSGCLTGDIFGDQNCDCHSQMMRTMEYIHQLQNGLMVYTVEDDGRGRGTLLKLKVYDLRQKQNLTSREVCTLLGLPYEARDYYPLAQVLLDMGLEDVILLSENPNKKASLEQAGINVVGVRNIF